MLLDKRRRYSVRHPCCIIVPILVFLYIIIILFKSSLFDQELNNISNTKLSNNVIVKENNLKKESDDQIKTNKCKKLCPYSSHLTNFTLEFDSSHIIRHFPDFVCPQNFRNLADWVYEWPDQFHEQLTKTTDDGKIIASCLPPGSIIYVRQWALTDFFNKIYSHLTNSFVLISGEGDSSSPSHLELLEAADSKIIHWFGQNGQYDVSKSKKFTHIPIGINCYEMANAIRGVYSQHSEHTLSPIFNDTDEPSSYIQPQDISQQVSTTNTSKKNLVLINFSNETDGSGLRARIIHDVCTEAANKEKYPFITCIKKPYGVQIEKLPEIYQRNRQYPFWLSPRGGGLDCHRTWEALYLDIIPIVFNGSLNVLYENLPVVIINDHKELNEQFLYEKLNEITKKKLSKEKVYEYEKIRNAYWRHKILEKSRHNKRQDIYERTNQCWRAKSTVPIKR